jgi:hypothetical protein
MPRRVHFDKSANSNDFARVNVEKLIHSVMLSDTSEMADLLVLEADHTTILYLSSTCLWAILCMSCKKTLQPQCESLPLKHGPGNRVRSARLSVN